MAAARFDFLCSCGEGMSQVERAGSNKTARESVLITSKKHQNVKDDLKDYLYQNYKLNVIQSFTSKENRK